MFGTFVKYQFQHTYDAILAAPVDTEELVSAEALWIATRAGVYGCVPMLVAIPFGLDPSWGMLLVPPIAWISGFGWACFGIMIAGYAKTIENFSYIVSAVLTPLFLVAGTFFPISNLPGWAQFLANFNPLHQCVELVRALRVRLLGWDDLARLGVLLRLRRDHVAHRDSRDDAQADRLAHGGGTESVVGRKRWADVDLPVSPEDVFELFRRWSWRSARREYRPRRRHGAVSHHPLQPRRGAEHEYPRFIAVYAKGVG